MEYLGENLVFIVGAPRSGTTWLLALLGEHPDVVLATPQRLRLKRGELKTMESGIFVSGLSDDAIGKKFRKLSEDNPGKTIVEKTPVHVFHADRIKKVFPAADIVLVRRDGRACVASMLRAARENEWWEDTPDDARSAADTWRKYSIASNRCVREHQPVIVWYEELFRYALEMTVLVLDELRLDYRPALRMILKSAGGRNIPINGVYAGQGLDGWKRYLAAEEHAAFEEIAGVQNRKVMGGG